MVNLVKDHTDFERVLLAQFAVRISGTGPDAADAQPHGCPFFQVESLPGAIDILLSESDNSDAGGARNFNGLGLVFFGDVRNSPQKLRRHHAAGNVGRDGVGLIIALRNGSFFSQFKHPFPPDRGIGKNRLAVPPLQNGNIGMIRLMESGYYRLKLQYKDFMFALQEIFPL